MYKVSPKTEWYVSDTGTTHWAFSLIKFLCCQWNLAEHRIKRSYLPLKGNLCGVQAICWKPGFREVMYILYLNTTFNFYMKQVCDYTYKKQWNILCSARFHYNIKIAIKKHTEYPKMKKHIEWPKMTNSRWYLVIYTF